MQTSQPRTQPELLAPAGRLDVFRAVLQAGADAVYVAGKQFNMRRHRRDFNFTPEDLATAVKEAHEVGRKLYVTVNSLVGQYEVAALRDYLSELNDIGADAVIVQDLAVVGLCHKQNLGIPLHSSTMMNVSSAETATQLKRWGFTRLVTSRDITIDAVRHIKQQCDIEVEYFLHGDMCSALSGQCLTSGLIFGKSGNRGQCMKPCRWSYDLLSEGTGKKVKEGAFLLASRDLCLLQHIPELVDAGIDSLKIEGRMRPAETLVPVVEAYREALDRTLANPLAPSKSFSATEAQRRARTRDFTTGFAFRRPDDSFMDITGKREPIVFSTHGRIRTILEAKPPTESDSDGRTDRPAQTEISVVVGTPEGARSAMAADCDHLILSWEGNLTAESGWTLGDIEQLADLGRSQSIPVLLSTPRVLDERSARELRQLAQAKLPLSGFALASVGALDILGEKGHLLWADAPMNVLNAEAAKWLQRHGITRIMPALEASLPSITQMMQATPGCDFDFLAHGPLTGMLLEHCLIAMNILHASKSDFCPMPCAVDQFSLVDKKGNRRRIRPDRYCRSHLFMEYDLATLPRLHSLLAAGPRSLRIDGRLYSPEQIAHLIDLYRTWLTTPDQRPSIEADFEGEFPANQHTLGAYPRGICRDEEISRIDLKREEKNADQ